MSNKDLSSFKVKNIDPENQEIEFEDESIGFTVTVKTLKKNIVSVTITEPYKAIVKYQDSSEETIEILEA